MQTFYVSAHRLARRGLVVLLLLLVGAAQAQISQIQQLIPAAEFRSNLAFYGNSVAIAGDVMVVGAPGDGVTGAAYVYERSGDYFVQTARLQADDKANLDFFGTAVAVSGTTVVVGASGKDLSRGAVYVFSKTAGTWSQSAKLLAGDRGIGDGFGGAVAIAGSVLVVGASGDDTSLTFDHGAAYVFTQSAGTWSQTIKLLASDRVGGDNFGVAVGISGNTIAVGAHQEDNSTLNTSNALNNAGSVYIFDRPTTTWSQTTKLTPSDRAADDNFGRSVSLAGNTLVVGAPNRDEASVSNVGAAYVFDRSGSTWSQTTKLLASDPAANDNFGRSVGLGGTMIGVGAPNRDYIAEGDTATNAGATYVFEKGSSWSQSARLVATDAADDDVFGIAVGVSNGVLAIGANGRDGTDAQNGFVASAGAAYVFEKCTPPTVSVTPGSQSVCIGAQVTLQGTVAGRFLSYQWFQYVNGTNDIVIEGATTPSLTVTVNSPAAYVLKAINPCDTVTSNIVRLSIRPSTTLRSTTTTNQVCEGRNLTLSVSGGGPAPLTYAWRKGDLTSAVLGTGTSYTISNAQLSSAGSYFATVTSACASASVEIPVTVRYTRITSQPQSVNLCTGNATLSVGVEAVGVTVTYQWKRNGTNISGATQSSYVVASNRPGTYTVDVRSSCSTITSQGAVVSCANPRLSAEALAEPRLDVVPNPVNGRAIQCRVEGMDNPEFSLTSAAGRNLALAVTVGREPGEFVLTPRQRLPTGTYIVQASEGSRRVSQRVVVVE